MLPGLQFQAQDPRNSVTENAPGGPRSIERDSGRKIRVFVGEVAEWSIAAVLKTAGPQGPGGSNPSLSANFPL